MSADTPYTQAQANTHDTALFAQIHCMGRQLILTCDYEIKDTNPLLFLHL